MALLAGQTPGRAYDFIVVGGGTAGCVVARRLAEDQAACVLLIEAGSARFDDPEIEQAANWVALGSGRYDWGYSYAPNPHLYGRVIPIPRGKVLGGSSSTNAMLWYRGHPSDYDAWANAGATGWDHQSVLPYFKKCEDWEDGETPYRGAGGPMRIERARDLHPLAEALIEGSAELGFPVIEDANARSNEGATRANYNMRGDQRWSAARGYLKPALAWPNLTIATEAYARQLLFDGTRCTGVRHSSAGGDTVETLATQEVILALGAIDTPRLLMLSGLGDPAELKRLGIPARAALPGIGQNLQDHPLLKGVNFRSCRPIGPVRGNGGGAMLNWRSTAAAPAPGLHAILVQGRHASPEVEASHDLTGDIFALSPGLMRSKSVGSLRLEDARPGGRLTIQPNLLAEQADLDELAGAIETMMDLAATRAFKSFDPQPAAPGRRLDKAGRIAFARMAASTFFHTCGTCAMGSGDRAVTLPDLRVRGVEGLRIADASVIPIIPTCNTQAPVIMIAERAASFIKQGL